jgi:hypothetical protein
MKSSFTEELKEVEFQFKTNCVKIEKLEKQRDELKLKIAEQLEGSDKKYLKVITKLELKIKELLELEEELNSEIADLKSKLNNKMIGYTDRLVSLINKNNDLREFQKGESGEKNNEISNKIQLKKNEIAEKYEKIHQYLSKSGNSSRKNLKLIDDYLEKVQNVNVI